MKQVFVVAALSAVLGFAGAATAATVEAGAKVNVAPPAAAVDASANADAKAQDGMHDMHDMHDMGQQMGHDTAASAKAGVAAGKDAAVSTGQKIGDGAKQAGAKVGTGVKAAGKQAKQTTKSLTGAAGSTLGAVGGAVQGTADAATSGVSVEAGAKVEKK